jgi:hypothetical protein
MTHSAQLWHPLSGQTTSIQPIERDFQPDWTSRRGIANTILMGATIATAMLAGGANSSTANPITIAHVQDLFDQTNSGPGGGWVAAEVALVVPAATEQGLGEAVRRLHEASGLTWDQLGKLFGVSRRAVHHWANDSRMTARNARLLGELTRLVESLPGPGPEDRRAQLLTPQDNGYSVFDITRARNATKNDDEYAYPYSTAELMGVDDER